MRPETAEEYARRAAIVFVRGIPKLPKPRREKDLATLRGFKRRNRQYEKWRWGFAYHPDKPKRIFMLGFVGDASAEPPNYLAGCVLTGDEIITALEAQQ